MGFNNQIATLCLHHGQIYILLYTILIAHMNLKKLHRGGSKYAIAKGLIYYKPDPALHTLDSKP